MCKMDLWQQAVTEAVTAQAQVMHAVNRQEMPELEEGLSPGLDTDLKDGLDWHWLKVGSSSLCGSRQPVPRYHMQYNQGQSGSQSCRRAHCPVPYLTSDRKDLHI